MTFVLATANPGKLAEMRAVLSQLGFKLLTRKDLGIEFDIEETGTTFIENATLKAVAICNASGMPAIADDSGLIVDALGGIPGVYTSSFGGEGITSRERCLFLLSKMKGFNNMEQRTAKFVCTIVCAFPDGDIVSSAGECAGTISLSPAGDNGFGYDPVFIPEGETRTLAQHAPEEKNMISHRGKALREFAEALKEYIAKHE